MNQFSLKHQRGLTLVELMISIVLGLVISGAVIQSYLTSKQTYRISNGVNRVQENARFAHYFLTKDIRNAGNMNCINQVRNMLVGDPDEFLALKDPISGHNFTGTSSGQTYPLPAAATLSASTDYVNTPIAAIQEKAIKGSDILSFKTIEPKDIQIKLEKPIGANAINTVGAHGINEGEILLMGDCEKADLFQHKVNGSGATNLGADPNQGQANTPPGNKNLSSKKWGQRHDPTSKVFGFVRTYYYVGVGASGLPSLFRSRSGKAVHDASDAEELVEGVESMQILYGEDKTGDNNPNVYVSANVVSDWDAVVSVRFGLLMRSPNNASDADQATTYTLLDNIKFTHASPDNILRYPVNSTVKLRNRGLDVQLSIAGNVCNAGGKKNQNGC